MVELVTSRQSIPAMSFHSTRSWRLFFRNGDSKLRMAYRLAVGTYQRRLEIEPLTHSGRYKLVMLFNYKHFTPCVHKHIMQRENQHVIHKLDKSIKYNML
jgi:hypothetical protein